MRFGQGISLTVEGAGPYEHYLIPPLTLQMLLENAVKHNIILPDQPLYIRIETREDGKLIVQNNLQRKKSRVLSNRVGLANIVTKYKLLGEGDLPLDRCIAALKSIGYDAWACLETEKRWHPTAPDPEQSVPQFAAYMREHWKA